MRKIPMPMPPQPHSMGVRQNNHAPRPRVAARPATRPVRANPSPEELEQEELEQIDIEEAVDNWEARGAIYLMEDPDFFRRHWGELTGVFNDYVGSSPDNPYRFVARSNLDLSNVNHEAFWWDVYQWASNMPKGPFQQEVFDYLAMAPLHFEQGVDTYLQALYKLAPTRFDDDHKILTGSGFLIKGIADEPQWQQREKLQKFLRVPKNHKLLKDWYWRNRLEKAREHPDAYVKDPHPKVRKVAADHTKNANALLQLARDSDAEVLRTVMNNKKTPLEALKYIWDNQNNIHGLTDSDIIKLREDIMFAEQEKPQHYAQRIQMGVYTDEDLIREELATEWLEFCTEHGFFSVSAADIAEHYELSSKQQRWVRNFITRWNNAADSEDE